MAAVGGGVVCGGGEAAGKERRAAVALTWRGQRGSLGVCFMGRKMVRPVRASWWRLLN